MHFLSPAWPLSLAPLSLHKHLLTPLLISYISLIFTQHSVITSHSPTEGQWCLLPHACSITSLLTMAWWRTLELLLLVLDDSLWPSKNCILHHTHLIHQKTSSPTKAECGSTRGLPGPKPMGNWTSEALTWTLMGNTHKRPGPMWVIPTKDLDLQIYTKYLLIELLRASMWSMRVLYSHTHLYI